ncbi:MAG TPA: hypothetical protein VGS03_06175 [Candidatus Polarisedimenticolia bacterium]|nr:hypothetical protein [Candidatus Polarisedimenticolia bacterium]
MKGGGPMIRDYARVVLASLAIGFGSAAAAERSASSAQAPAVPTAVPASSYQALEWRLLGPFRGGWATVAAGIPGDAVTFYFGSADGGVWKTDDAGVTWKPLFNNQGSASIGALAIAPGNPKVIWVGTGQMQQRWDIAEGDGVYRSTDGGATWKHLGLEQTRHIGQIWVDPKNADVAIVAAVGHMFGPNPERGLFRTADGGRTWTKVLDRGPDVGAVDIASDPAVPGVLYASTWEVRRHPWLDYWQPPAGPGSGIWKSTDSGRTWKPSGMAGLPKTPMGRIDLGVAPGRQARRVYAGIDAHEGGGLYRSDDGGATWTQVNPDTDLAGSYMNCIVPDPKNPDIVWAAGRGLRRSTDGGKTFSVAKGAPGGDDYHFLYIDPRQPRRMMLAADQGAAVTHNAGETWSSWYNQPTGQFYRLAVDDQIPYRIYSGQQDSGTVSIASRSDYGQLTFRDWNPTGGDERDGDVPDPANPDIVYGAGLGGRLSRWDATTAQVQNVTPWPISTYGQRPQPDTERYSWITPLAISKRPPHALYHGTQNLFRSTDGGHSWTPIAADLTGAAKKPENCDGDVPVERASACGYGVIFAVSPSAAADGVVWIGTDNGRVQVTKDEGGSWTDVTPRGMADWTKVNFIDLDPEDAGVAYVSADRHRLDDRRPLAWRTKDSGATWTEIGAGLPKDHWVGVVRHDPKRPGLLFAGTNRGVHVSFDDGSHWQPLQLNLPTTGINDLVVHDDDIIVATQGRGLWALDDIEPLRQLAASMTGAGDAKVSAGGLVLVKPLTGYRIRSNQNKDTPLPAEEPRGENPPVGAILDYLLPGGATGPVTIEIADEAGTVLTRFRSDQPRTRETETVYFEDKWGRPLPSPTARPGHNRFVWDLRLPPPRALEPEYTIAAVPEEPEYVMPAGAFVLPGRYEVRLTAGGATVTQPLAVELDPRLKVKRRDLEDLLSFQREVGATLAQSASLVEEAEAIRQRLEKALKDPKVETTRPEVRRALDALKGLDEPRDERPRRANQLLSSLATDLESVDAAPTDPQHRMLTHFRDRLKRYQARFDDYKTKVLAAADTGSH